ncbi:MAG TPA: hypothetical protein PK014_14465 [Thermoanaerobaculia bacterium]|nr:hypothetical protein [Thermoanaerobaculia bacterium]HUM31243.1 hypothetical protein [Thermoanaerobaculia bacterium]HXK69599.1 hypothetical protein [Thermoanaerobaculia bacterium]
MEYEEKVNRIYKHMMLKREVHPYACLLYNEEKRICSDILTLSEYCTANSDQGVLKLRSRVINEDMKVKNYIGMHNKESKAALIKYVQEHYQCYADAFLQFNADRQVALYSLIKWIIASITSLLATYAVILAAIISSQ